MRFLFCATVGAYNSLMTDGSTILLMSVVRDLSESGKHFCYVLFPAGCDLDTLPPLPRVMYLTTEVPVKNLDGQMTCVDQVMINDKFGVYGEGKYLIDAAVVLHPAQVIPLRQALGLVARRTGIPVFVLEQGTNWYTTDPNYSLENVLEQWGALGACFSNMVVMSPFDAKNWVDKAAACDLSPHQRAQLHKNMRVASAPINMDNLMALQSIAQTRYDTPTCLWAARTNATKNPKAVLDVFDSLYKQGENMQVRYLSQTSHLKGGVVSSKLELFDGREYISPIFAATQQDFYREAAKSHVFVCWSHSESYNSSAVEASLLGCVFLCVDKPQFRDLYPLGLGGDEFWLTPSTAEARVQWVLRNYEQAYAMQSGLRKEFMRQQTEQRISQVLVSALRAHYAEEHTTSQYELSLTSGLGRIMVEVFHGLPDEFTMYDMLAGISASANNFKLDNLTRFMTRKLPVNWSIHNMLLRFLGAEDVCDGRFPKYRKVTP